jgi:hypothetical protein
MTIIGYNEFLRSFKVRPKNSISIFLGAGSSVQAGVPSGGQLVWHFKRTIFCQETKTHEDKFKDLESERNRTIIQEHFDLKGGYPDQYSKDEYSFYFEKCYPESIDRKFFLQSKVNNIKPSIGHLCLGSLVESGKVQIIWTTNFDELIESGVKAVNSAFSFELVSSESKGQLESLNTYARIVKLHGDYRYDKLQNTNAELKSLESEFQKYLNKVSLEKGMIINGYSGSDESIMSSLESLLIDAKPFPYGLYWCVRKGQKPNTRVIEFVESVRSKTGLAGFIEIDNFDSFLYDLYRTEGLSNTEIEKIAETLFTKRKPFVSPLAKTSFDPIKLNALKAKTFPNTLLSFKSTISSWKELRELNEGQPFVLALSKGDTYAFGNVSNLKKVLGERITSEITPIDIDTKFLFRQESFYFGMLYDLIDYSLRTNYKLENISKGTYRKYTAATVPVTPAELSSLNIGIKTIYEAFELQIEFHNKELYLVLLPSIHIANDQISRVQRQDIHNKIISNRYNSKTNDAIKKWLSYFKQCATPIRMGTDSFIIELSDNLTFAGTSQGNAHFFTGAFTASEPSLRYSLSDKNAKTPHPLKGLSRNGPYDYSYENKSKNPSPIKIAILAPDSGFQKILTHLNGLNNPSEVKSERDYLINFSGFLNVYRKYLEIPNSGSHKYVRLIKESDVQDMDHIKFYDHIKRNIDYFYPLLLEFDVLIVYFPKAWARFREVKDSTYYFDFHDSLKLYCAKKSLKIQFIEDKSIEYFDPSKVKWWLSLGLYAKANGVPWVIDTDSNDSAFIGLSYAIRNSTSNKKVVLGSSQIFDSSGQGLRFLLQNIEHPVFYGRNPFMSKEDARRLVLKLKDAYRRIDPNSTLKRIVIHKTTHFTGDEIEGIAQALEGIENVELLHIQQQTNWRGIRGNVQQKIAHMFPIQRGTVIQLDDFSFLIWTHGSVQHADVAGIGMNYYQGKRGIPAPLLVRRVRGTAPIEVTVNEILRLTKVNWNGGELYKILPVTIDFSSKLAVMAKQEETLQEIPYDFRYFI